MAGEPIIDSAPGDDLRGRATNRGTAADAVLEPLLTLGGVPTSMALPPNTLSTTRGGLRLTIPAVASGNRGRPNAGREHQIDTRWVSNRQQVNGAPHPVFDGISSRVAQMTTVTGPNGNFMRVQGLRSDGTPDPNSPSLYYRARLDSQGRWQPDGDPIGRMTPPATTPTWTGNVAGLNDAYPGINNTATSPAAPNNTVLHRLDSAHTTIGAQGGHFTRPDADGNLTVASVATSGPRRAPGMNPLA